MTPEELVKRTGPAIGGIGPAFYFIPETIEAGRKIGLDGFRFYFLGRGGVLGDVPWSVVHSSFGYFEPSLLEKMWESGRKRCDVATAAAAYLLCCQDFGRAHLADVEGLGAFCEAATAVNDAARPDPAGLTLWAGLAAAPLAVDAPARAMQIIATLRELRGSAHLLAVVASGVPTPVAHLIRRPDDLGLFGWAPGMIPEPTDEDRRNLAAADDLTDRLVTPAFSVLDESGSNALLRGLEGIGAALNRT